MGIALLVGVTLFEAGRLGAEEDEVEERAPEAVAAPTLGEDDLLQIREIMVQMCNGFMQGKPGVVMRLFGGKAGLDPDRRDRISANLERELACEAYGKFKVLDAIEPDGAMVQDRYRVWVRLYYEYAHRNAVQGDAGGATADAPINRNYHNEIFVFRKDRHGRFWLADSAFFDTLGRRGEWEILHHALWGSIVVLALMGFWVWMGFEAFRMRPRRRFWRLAVLLAPLAGALLFFVGVYLSGLGRARRRASAERA